MSAFLSLWANNLTGNEERNWTDNDENLSTFEAVITADAEVLRFVRKIYLVSF